MFKRNLLALLAGYTSHVHQTRAVWTSDKFSTRLDVALHLVESHLGGYSRFLYREHATKATALVRTLWFHDIDAINQLQQVLDLIELVNMLLRRGGES